MYRHTIFFAITGIILAGCSELPRSDPPVDPVSVTYLDQGWGAEMRDLFYHTPQGSQLTPYRWFLALEHPSGEGLLRDDAHFERLRFVVDRTSGTDLNPDGLPVGFTREPFPGGEDWLGLTCSACHTSQIEYEGTNLRIDGGPALADLTGFFAELDQTLQKTVDDDAWFGRFAEKILGDASSGDDRAALRTAVKSHRAGMPRVPPHAGFGRQDAFGAILNEVTGTELGQPDNYRLADAPVSYPFLWGTSHLARVQWLGLGVNPIGRNIGQVFGVFGHVNLTASGDLASDLFDSTVRLHNLYALEQWIADLKPPTWPAETLGEIDETLAARGREVYTENNRCSACHPLPPYPLTPKEENKFGKQFVQIRMVPVAMIGTDPRAMTNVITRQAKAGNLAPLLGGRETVTAAEILLTVTGQVLKRLVREQQLSEEQQVAYSGFRFPPQPPPDLQAYKARPLDGIWATAPYLHNGSVPNLYQLMLSPDHRDKSFYLGAREFDPKHVGFVTHETPGAYLLDTEKEGNWNIGHDRAGDLSEEDRWALVEFLKTR